MEVYIHSLGPLDTNTTTFLHVHSAAHLSRLFVRYLLYTCCDSSLVLNSCCSFEPKWTSHPISPPKQLRNSKRQRNKGIEKFNASAINAQTETHPTQHPISLIADHERKLLTPARWLPQRFCQSHSSYACSCFTISEQNSASTTNFCSKNEGVRTL